jgi:DnaK suppressor protein
MDKVLVYTQNWNIANIFIGLSMALLIFVFWNEGRRDGFDKYRLFDLTFTLSILSGLMYMALSRWLVNLSIVYYNSYLLKINSILLILFVVYLVWCVGIFAFARAFNWSVYRLVDIFSLALVVMALPMVVYLALTTRDLRFVWLYLPYAIFYKLIFSRRHYYGYISGFSFIFLNFLHASIFIFLPEIRGKLPIALILITMSSVALFFRKKKTVSNTNLPKSFIEFVKSQLRSKEAELTRQEQLLKSEDPYLDAGRAFDNSDEMDEAILEDNRKELTDARLGLVRAAKLQVKRALAFLKLGKYGICEICGKPIDPARLKVYPEATTCVEHASRSRR